MMQTFFLLFQPEPPCELQREKKSEFENGKHIL